MKNVKCKMKKREPDFDEVLVIPDTWFLIFNYYFPTKIILIIIKAFCRAGSSPSPQGEGLG